MPTAVIADDEYLQRDELRRMLSEAWPQLVIVAECEDGSEALDAIVKHQPDIAFLDIRMPGLSGLDVARATDGKCNIVFVTAYDVHAIDAFNLAACDYLLKPIQGQRLAQTIERVQNKLATGEKSLGLLQMMETFEKRLSENASKERIRWISANAGKSIQIFPVEDILFFESDTRYTRVVSATDEGLIRTAIKDLQKGLDAEQFWQINRGILVNMHAIARAHRDEFGGIKVEIKGCKEQLKVSQTYAWRFKGN
ncbi:LytR/AlgR family response regulator transcription factor [Solimicrobium silvestre]|uniref:Response regulator of the LytR/AlgR family n=1 Tax=Solimicrobium silvestre TaxID=2099400 RepID=A0A2S9GYZ2_9BURK|nr:LytTR family DNA-binding domain-containing protein [Solimicrobium silvestre]PRC92918.1 Response regulator of the LytR/AlgR family [Solimicrobium silvestre]